MLRDYLRTLYNDKLFTACFMTKTYNE